MSVEPGADARLTDALRHRFTDEALLQQAFRHRSWCAENEGSSNERLEFLGDAVLGLAVTDHAFASYPDLPEGALAKVRATVVSAASLADLARRLALGEHLRLGRGEEATGGRDKPSILADALEAVIGAVYLDGGWPVARRVVVHLVGHLVAAAAEGPGTSDFKTRLQEWVVRQYEDDLRYAMSESGPDHEKWFAAQAMVGELTLGRGEGRSKKQAQQAAARDAWETVRQLRAAKPGDGGWGRSPQQQAELAEGTDGNARRT